VNIQLPPPALGELPPPAFGVDEFDEESVPVAQTTLARIRVSFILSIDRFVPSLFQVVVCYLFCFVLLFAVWLFCFVIC